LAEADLAKATSMEATLEAAKVRQIHLETCPRCRRERMEWLSDRR